MPEEELATHPLLAALRTRPDDIVTLAEFASLAAREGKLDAALSAIDRAISLAPESSALYVRRGHIHHDRGAWQLAAASYEAAFRLGETDPRAHEGAAYTADRLNDPVRSAWHRERAFRDRGRTSAPFTGLGKGPRVLLLVSSLGGNLDTRPYLSQYQFALTKIVVEYDAFDNIPPFDGIFNAVGDADRCEAGLRKIAAFCAQNSVPIINQPARILETTRVRNAERLGELADVRTARVRSLTRQEIAAPKVAAQLVESDVSFPLIVRALGYHTGEYCTLVHSIDALRAAAADFPGERFLISEFIDVRQTDGFVRKYRVMSIDGVLYPLHMAAARDWKVHYAGSAMNENAALRAEEAEFLHDPAGVLGTRAWNALLAIADRLALDYAGIDFGCLPDGQIVCFEANATMVVPPAALGSQWDYRRAAPTRIHAAVARLLRAEFNVHRRTPNFDQG